MRVAVFGKARGHQHEVVEADGVGGGLFAVGHGDDPVAGEAARGGEAVGRQDRVGVQKRAVGLEVEDAGGRVDLAHRVAPGGDEAGQVRRSRRRWCGRSGRRGSRVSVTRMSPPSMKLSAPVMADDLPVKRAQVGGHLGGLAQPRGRAGAHDDGALGQAKRGILDEDAVGIGVERGQVRSPWRRLRAGSAT